MSENRAKYSTEDLRKLGGRGHAMRADHGWIYPTVDAEDVKLVVREVVRADSKHDSERRYAIKRAIALGEGVLIPENWAPDGTLRSQDGVWATPEERETAMDTLQALEGALEDYFEEHVGPYCYVWVKDFTPDRVIYCTGGDTFSAPYTLTPGGPVMIDVEAADEVRPVTEYVPTDGGGAEAGETERASAGAVIARVAAPLITNSGFATSTGTGTLTSGGATINVSGSAVARAIERTPNTIALRRSKMPKRGERETRTLALESLEVREVDGDDPEAGFIVLEGYASVFNVRYSVGPYEETIAPGAFRRSVSNAALDCVLRTQHSSLPIARTTGRVTLRDGTEVPTLTLSEDDHGLRIRALLDPEDPDVQSLVPKLRRGDLSEMSFAFRASDDLWSDDYSKRTIRTAELHRGDVSIVTYGASAATTVSMRSEEVVTLLREHGYGALVAALTEWRDFTLLPIAEREGHAPSDSTQALLAELGDIFSTGEGSADERAARLADLFGVPSPTDVPQEDGGGGGDGARSGEEPESAPVEGAVEPRSALAPLPPPQYAEALATLRARGIR